MIARVLAAVMVAALTLPGAAAGHDLDHSPPATAPDRVTSTTFISGGPGAKWELVATFLTGNPHTDLDFFTKGGDTYASVGTLAVGPNAGGQTILRLAQGSAVSPAFVSSHPSAACSSDPAVALGLQHDAEATPKGDVLFNEANPFAVRRDAQLLLDATDSEGRCHDTAWGGLEVVDVTNVAVPKEIALTSHIGEAHTVNVDPKRPHIAYAVTSDAIGIAPDGHRLNEDAGSLDRLDLDGFEVVDLSSCMNFPAGTSVEQKRSACRPRVYRYRFPSATVALGHTTKASIFGCHELEVYANDLLACGSGGAGLLFDMRGAFDDRGTPLDFTDDKPRGAPLPCSVRPSLSPLPTFTQAMVTDCVGQGGSSLDVPSWLAMSPRPELEGVRYLGSVHHQGRGGPYSSPEDNDFDHELELTQSGKFLIASDERAVCSPGPELEQGNGGLHAYPVDRLTTSGPGTKEQAWASYAHTPSGGKAIYRAPIRKQPEGALCTAHVFQQIPGQNRIFMGWYSQGTRVVDFVEHADGSFEFREAGWFIPEHANTWVSHVFRVDPNADCTFTYWGATGDYSFGGAGRNAIDVYKVTLPAPPNHLCAAPGTPPPSPPPQPPPAGPRAPGASSCTISGTAGRDRLVGTRRADVICGRGGNDVISGLGGADRLYGGAGNDRLLGGAGNDRVYGGAGADRAYGAAGADLVAGDAGNDRLYAGAGRNRLLGERGNDLLWARNGVRDRVAGGSGVDRAVLDRVDLAKHVERLLRK